MPWLPSAPDRPQRLFYRLGGRGPLLVLLHNGFFSARSWEPLLPLLETEFTCLAWDRRAYGRSEGDLGRPGSIAEGVEELEALLAQAARLGVDTGRAHLWGHCLGAAVAVHWAAARPERCASLALEALGYFSSPRIRRRVNQVCRPWDELPDSFHAAMRQMHGPDRAPLVWAAIARQDRLYVADPDYDLRPRLAGLAAAGLPIFAAAGDRDVYFDPSHAAEGAAAAGAELWLPRDCGHDIHRERPAAVHARWRAFLAERGLFA